MLALLALRNVVRNGARLAPVIVIVAVVFAVMVVGNAVLAASGTALYDTYARHVAGDLSVSAAGDSNFTIFGSDALLVGEFLTAATIPEFDRLASDVRTTSAVRAAAGVVSAPANVEIAGARRNRTLFGVSFPEYLSLFPDLVFVAGGPPAPGEPGIVVQEEWVGEAGAEALLGLPALLASGSGRSFTLREVPVTGVIRYPVDDQLLNTVALIDADTARALNGYLYGALEVTELNEDESAVFDADVDALFGGGDAAGGAGTTGDGGGAVGEGETGDGGGAPADSSVDSSLTGSDSGGPIDLGALLGGDPAGDSAAPAESTPPAESIPPAGTENTPVDDSIPPADRARETIAGTWNFLLIALENPEARGAVQRTLEAQGYTTDQGFRVRPWWETVGGNASLVRYLQILFNAGVIFVAVGATIITTNALVLSVLERTGEIGTMRAIGAGRGRVAALITIETVIVVVGSAVIGIALGIAGVSWLNDAAYVVSNQYIRILFGGEPVTGAVTAGLIAGHAVAALLLAAVAVVYPLKRALGVSPREAMAA